MITQRDVMQHKTALPKEVYLLHCDNFMIIHSSDEEIKRVKNTRTLEPWPGPPGSSRSRSRLGLSQSTGLSICIHRLELHTSIQRGQPHTWACKYSDGSREIPGEVVGGENQSRCSGAHFDWPRSLGCGFQNPKWVRRPQDVAPGYLGWWHIIPNPTTRRSLWPSFGENSQWRHVPYFYHHLCHRKEKAVLRLEGNINNECAIYV